MHVCMLTDYFLPHILGGTEKVVYEVGKRLVKKGCQVTVVTLNTDRVEATGLVDGMNVYRLPAISVTEFIGAQLTLSPLALLMAQRIVEKVRPDIVHAHNLYFQLTMFAPFIRILSRLPLVTTLHLPQMVYNQTLLDSLIGVYQRFVGQFIIRCSDRVIVVSHSIMNHAVADLGIPFSKLVLIPNGVDTSLYSPSGVEPKNPVITYVGRLIWNKGPQYLVKAAPSILENHPDAVFYIIGDGPLKENLLQQVISHRIQDRIHILGAVPDIAPFLQMTTVFIRPSLTGEAISLAILEAMACGLPVVASNVEGNKEIVEDGVNGYLVPPGDSKALSEAIRLLLGDIKAARMMGHNARKTVEKVYDWKRTAEQTLQVYNSLT